jgi:glycosyltransferase involved in cell wall biosynthesis
MKILNVNMSLDPINGGGGVERTFQISKSFVKAGLECTVLTTDLGLTRERVEDMKEINVIALPCLNKRFYLPKFSFTKIKKLIEGVDIIHLMGHWTLLNAFVYLMARYLKKPYCVCPAGSLPIFGRSRVIKRFYNMIIGKKIVREAHGHIAVAENEIRQFAEYGVNTNSISIIPNGVNSEDFLSDDVIGFRKKNSLLNKPFILFLGRLNMIKGPDLLLQAFQRVKSKLPNFHLVLVGPDGGMLNKLKNMVMEFQMEECVHFFGYLGGIEKSNIYHAADLLAIPSRQEAMSIVVLEAGISGTPVLLSDQCGFNVIEKIDGGKVVQASVNGLESGLLDMLVDSDRLDEMGAKLKRFTCENFTWDVITEKYLLLFNRILDEMQRSN